MPDFRIEPVSLDAPTLKVQRYQGRTGETDHFIFGFTPVTEERIAEAGDKVDSYLANGWWKKLQVGEKEITVEVPFYRAYIHNSSELRTSFVCSGGLCCEVLGPPKIYYGVPIGKLIGFPKADNPIIQWYFWKIPQNSWDWITANFQSSSPVDVVLSAMCEDEKFQRLSLGKYIRGNSVYSPIKPEQYQEIIDQSVHIRDNPPPPFGMRLTDEELQGRLDNLNKSGSTDSGLKSGPTPPPIAEFNIDSVIKGGR